MVRTNSDFWVPLCPYITFTNEAPVTSLQVFAYLAQQASQGNRDRFPIGLVDDNVEATFDMTVTLLQRIAPDLLAREEVIMNRRAKRIEGFFRGTDVIHVLWRLVDVLDKRSYDFFIASCAFRLLFFKVFQSNI